MNTDELKELCNTGVLIDKVGHSGSHKSEYRGLAFMSLRLSLKAYFSTYRSVKHRILTDDEMKRPGFMENYHSDEEYFECCTESILHFQHFVELIIRDILRKKHELLAVDAAKTPKILYKLLKRKRLTREEENDAHLNFIEISTCLERITRLISDKVFSKATYGFFIEEKQLLTEINKLRNRFWHRGRFILSYEALDRLFGKYILPLMLKILKLRRCKKRETLWKYKVLHFNAIDPIVEIITEFKNAQPDLRKIAFLKELARAAYNNPLYKEVTKGNTAIRSGLNDLFQAANMKMKKKYHSFARHESGIGLFVDKRVKEIRDCPVCGTKSLLLYEDNEEDEVEYDEEGVPYPKSFVYFVSEVKCLCCSFEIHNNIDNPKEYGYDIADFWQDTKLDPIAEKDK